MGRARLARTSVKRTFTSATTGTTSDGGCDDTDMADRTYWLRAGTTDRIFEFQVHLGIPDRHLRQASVKTKRSCVKIKRSWVGIGIEKA